MIRRGLVSAPRYEDPRLRQTLMGAGFLNPIGLAAGFDKNGVAMRHWHRLGFGFAEVGTVTALAQPGNPKPRLFRLPEDRALINRFGFNNLGSEALAERFQGLDSRIPIGINLGKSKLAKLERASEDYAASFRALHSFGDYFVINVSSPNTPGLRSLQDAGALRAILGAIAEIDATRPIFVKVAPDLEFDALDELVEVCGAAAGFIATNTTLSRTGLQSRQATEAGGLSGAPLAKRAYEVLSHLRAAVKSEQLLIGVGGIFDACDVAERIAAGAHLVQLYTGWVYGGPNLVPRLCRGLAKIMEREGFADLTALRASGIQPGTLPRE